MCVLYNSQHRSYNHSRFPSLGTGGAVLLCQLASGSMADRSKAVGKEDQIVSKRLLDLQSIKRHLCPQFLAINMRVRSGHSAIGDCPRIGVACVVFLAKRIQLPRCPKGSEHLGGDAWHHCEIISLLFHMPSCAFCSAHLRVQCLCLYLPIALSK